MGLELLRVNFQASYWLICLLVIGLVLLGRFVAIWVPYRLARPWLDLDSKAPIMLTWGGLRGGISIALALSIPDTLPQKDLLVAITYAVVLFSIIVQGLTMERLIQRLYPDE